MVSELVIVFVFRPSQVQNFMTGNKFRNEKKNIPTLLLPRLTWRVLGVSSRLMLKLKLWWVLNSMAFQWQTVLYLLVGVNRFVILLLLTILLLSLCNKGCPLILPNNFLHQIAGFYTTLMIFPLVLLRDLCVRSSFSMQLIHLSF